MNDTFGFFAILIGGFVFGGCAGMTSTTRNLRSEAVKHNAAQFVIVNPATGETAFKWNDEISEAEK